MTNEEFRKRILETKKEIFPLDRLLPLETVYSIWKEEYTKTNDRNLFFRDRKFQRLREGYFTLFAAISLNDTKKENHFLLFPGAQDNDVYIVCPRGDQFPAYKFDVKEFTNWSDSFVNFVDKKVIPKIKIYNVIIATYRKIGGDDFSYLVKCLNQKNITARIWIVSAPTEDNDDNEISKVTIVSKDSIYDKILNLNDWIDKNKTPVVYQNVIRFLNSSSRK